VSETPKRSGGWPDKPPVPGGGYAWRNRGAAPVKPIFAVDLDSTIYNMESVLADAVRIVTGVRPSPPTCWDSEVAFGLNPTDLGKVWDLVWSMDIKPFTGAYQFLNQLRKDFEVVSLSTRKVGEPRNHGIAMTEDLPVDRKMWTVSPEDKAFRLQRMGAKYFLDDSAANHIAAAKLGLSTNLLLLDKPWNQSQDIKPVWQRVYTYEEVLEIASE
jgi:hypothetical protein